VGGAGQHCSRKCPAPRVAAGLYGGPRTPRSDHRSLEMT
jgi:hypothetical protein